MTAVLNDIEARLKDISVRLKKHRKTILLDKSKEDLSVKAGEIEILSTLIASIDESEFPKFFMLMPAGGLSTRTPSTKYQELAQVLAAERLLNSATSNAYDDVELIESITKSNLEAALEALMTAQEIVTKAQDLEEDRKRSIRNRIGKAIDELQSSQGKVTRFLQVADEIVRSTVGTLEPVVELAAKARTAVLRGSVEQKQIEQQKTKALPPPDKDEDDQPEKR